MVSSAWYEERRLAALKAFRESSSRVTNKVAEFERMMRDGAAPEAALKRVGSTLGELGQIARVIHE